MSGTVIGQSSKTYGYCSGGDSPYYNNIEKFSFSSDGDSTDVGNLVSARKQGGGTGTQY